MMWGGHKSPTSVNPHYAAAASSVCPALIGGGKDKTRQTLRSDSPAAKHFQAMAGLQHTGTVQPLENYPAREAGSMGNLGKAMGCY